MQIAHHNHIKHLRTDEVRLGDFPDCAISTATSSQGRSYKETLQRKKKNGVRITSEIVNSSCECAPNIVFQSFPLLVLLDSLGGITCSRLVMSPIPVSCSAKIAASHISGVEILSYLSDIL